MSVLGSLVERLLAGEFICAVTDEEAFRRLSEPDLQEEINHYLQPLNRRLATDSEEQVFYLAWKQLTPTARQQLEQQLNHLYLSLIPVLEWMQLVQEALGRDALLNAGDLLRTSEFLQRCEEHQALRARVQQLANDRFFNSQSEALDQQIKLIFKRMKEQGYLVQPHQERGYFMVTNKVNYLLDMLRFIRDEQQLPLDEPEQQEVRF
ncbi:condensin complex protein MksE [Marinospirillum sp.]|uniref:condensin complex protein MksE n=1 Tax=Marinospirillum sp. TaxID=2183934 RepID=UPI003A86D4F9